MQTTISNLRSLSRAFAVSFSAALLLTGCGGGGETPPPAALTLQMTPGEGAADVPVDQPVTATFAEALDPTTTGGAALRLELAGSMVAGTVTLQNGGRNLVFTPAAALEAKTRYSATVSADLRSVSGRRLPEAKSWSFETSPAAPPILVPRVASTTPTERQLGVRPDAVIVAVFDQPMATDTINAQTFTLRGPQGDVAAQVAYDAEARAARLTPTQALAPEVDYTANLAAGVKSAAGVGLVAVAWSFQTAVRPTVRGTSPTNGQRSVAVRQVISVTFDQAMDPVTLNAQTLQLRGSQGPIEGAVAYDAESRTARLTPTRALDPEVDYTASLSNRISSSAGVPLALTEWSFRTVDRPTILSTVPGNGQRGVSPMQVLAVTFDRDMNPVSMDADSVRVQAGARTIPGAISYVASERTMFFRASPGLDAGASHTVFLSAAITDTNGVGIAPRTFSFEVDRRPVIAATVPAHQATGVARDTAIEIRFDVPIDPTSITSDSVRLSHGGQPVAGATAPFGAQAIQFQADDLLAMGGDYRATVSRNVRGQNQITLGVDYVFDFTIADGAWAAQVQVATLANTADAQPDLAFSSSGTGMAVWLGRTSSGYRPFAAHFAAGVWGAPQQIDRRTTGNASAPRVAIDDLGNAIAVWDYLDASVKSVRFNRYEAGTGWRSDEGYLPLASNSQTQQSQPRIATTSDGGTTVVWFRRVIATQDWNVVYRRFVPGSGWDGGGQVLQIDARNQPFQSLRLAMDRDGRAVILFVKNDAGRYRIHASTGSPTLAWTSLLPIDDANLVSGNDSVDPVVAIENGVVLAAWIQNSPLNSVWRNRLWANRFEFTQSRWDGPRLADDENQDDAAEPAVAMSPNGSAMLAWRQKRGASPQLPMLGDRLLDATLPLAQALAAAPRLRNVDLRGFGDATPGALRLGMDRDGNALLVYRQESNTGRFDVLSQRCLAGRDWANAAGTVELHPMPAQAPVFAMAADGTAHVLWYAYENTQGVVLANSFR